MEIKELSCFIIMPFSASETHTEIYWNNHFTFFLREIISDIGNKLKLKINVERSAPIRGNISNQIIFNLVRSDIVIADLTDFNRNVMWELGVRQSFKHSTILIGEEGTEKKLPFDISNIALIHYTIDHSPKNPSTITFSENLEKAIVDCINNPERSDSPVLEALSGRSTFYEIITKNETIRKVEGLITECVNNELLLQKSLQAISNHKKNPPDNAIPPDRIRIESIALLMTHRYINKKSEFYDEADRLYTHLIAIDKVLEAWIHSPEGTDLFLEEKIPSVRTYLNEFLSKIREILLEIQNCV